MPGSVEREDDVSLEYVEQQARAFCKVNHCIWKVAYLPCFEKYVVRFKKITHSPGDSDSAYRILVEREHLISSFEHALLANAIIGSLEEASSELENNSHKYFDVSVEAT